MEKDFKNDLYKLRAQDVVLASALVFVSVLWLAAPSGAGGGGASAARVYHNGREVGELRLDRRETRSFSFEAGRITVEAVPGEGVHISESNCPAKVCVHSGWAGRPGETIACLPNKLLVEIEGEDREYDAVIR